MEGLLPLHLCHSQYSSLLALHPLRFLFLIFAISIISPASPSRACPHFKCGEYPPFPYPFGQKNSGCGDPTLQLECIEDVWGGHKALINIGGYQYYIWEVSLQWEEDHIMTIIDKSIWLKACNPSLFSNQTSEISPDVPRFHNCNGRQNITVGEQCSDAIKGSNSGYVLPCNESWYLSYRNESSLESMCKSSVTFQVASQGLDIQEGFRVKWDPNKMCTDCMSGGGFCAYNISDSMQIYCERPKDKPPEALSDDFLQSIGGIIGSAALLLMGSILLFLNRKRFSPTSSKGPDLSGVEKFLQDYVHQMPSRYSYSQLMKITDKFAHKVGEGGYGVVYKGKLPTGELVAVKMLDQSRRCENQFTNEVATLGRIHHVHLVRLMGYCFEEYRNGLVYDYMANGSLDEFIFAGRDKEQILNWGQLYSIALGAARGIAYLHQDCDNRIIHFDIKPHNILLDEDFTPKVADFGLAKLCGKKDDHISMPAARGTPGYAAPEVWSRNLGAVTDKSDVYSFGMLLLEIVGGRKNIELQVSRSSQLYFPEWAFKLLMENGQFGRGLRGRGEEEIQWEDEEKAKRMAKVGLWCIQYNSRDRPSMSRVVQMLEGNGDDVGNPPLPFNSSIRAAPSIHTSEESSV